MERALSVWRLGRVGACVLLSWFVICVLVFEVLWTYVLCVCVCVCVCRCIVLVCWSR